MTKDQKLKLIKEAKYQSLATILCYAKKGIELGFGQSSFDRSCYWETQTKKTIRTIKEEDSDVIAAGVLKIKELGGKKSFWENFELYSSNETPACVIKNPDLWHKNEDGSYTAKK